MCVLPLFGSRKEINNKMTLVRIPRLYVPIVCNRREHQCVDLSSSASVFLAGKFKFCFERVCLVDSKEDPKFSAIK